MFDIAATGGAPVRCARNQMRTQGAFVMKLRAQIIIDVEAGDYVAAAEFQREMELLMADVRRRHEQAMLELKECRPPSPRSRRGSSHSLDRSTYSTGAVNFYEDS